MANPASIWDSAWNVEFSGLDVRSKFKWINSNGHTTPGAGLIFITALPSSDTLKTVQSRAVLLSFSWLLAQVWRTFCSSTLHFCGCSPSDHLTERLTWTPSLFCDKVVRERRHVAVNATVYDYCSLHVMSRSGLKITFLKHFRIVKTEIQDTNGSLKKVLLH